MERISPNGIIGTGQQRIDGIAKVTGAARYGADQLVLDPVFAALATSPIARGRIRTIDQTAARAMPGVLEILTYENVGSAVKPGKSMLEGGYMSQGVAPLASNRIHFAGQIVAVVFAETLPIAEAAVQALRISYKSQRPTVSFNDPGTRKVKAKALGETELSAGDLEKGFAAAAAIVDAEYATPPQHHNPMELFQTTCAWNDGKLTVWESSQNVRGFQYGLAQQLGISTSKIRVLSHLIGGAFGSRGELGQHTALIALAAKRLGRPVKLVASRQQGFTLRTFRAETQHHIRIGADKEGQLTALLHESWELCSRKEHFAVAGSDSTARLYACPNVRTKVVNIEADRQASGFMRAPPETPYLFAMECAMDELAYALAIDPLELRRRNETTIESVSGKPYTSRGLLRCIDKGAEVFGWGKRDPRPRSMQDGNDLVGWGYATAFYPAQIGPAQCTVSLSPELHATISIGTHEIGTGVRTVVAQTAADLLGLELGAIRVLSGDSDLPAAPLSAGSNSTATVCSVVAIACEALRERVAHAAAHAKASPLHGEEPARIRLHAGFARTARAAEPLKIAIARAGKGDPLVQNSSNNPHGAPPLIGPALVSRGKPLILGGSNLKDRMQFAHGAQFVEVRIDRLTGQIRVPRMVGVFAAGRIMNPRTARSQLNGGQVWGIGAALLEASELDRPTGHYVNDNLAEYHVAVSADVGSIESIMLEETDTLINPLGIKGVGELGITGVNAAIANAVFHATGNRVRKLPIRPEHVMANPIA